MKVALRVIPNATDTSVTGPRGDEIVVRVNEPATAGKAKRAVRRYLARKPPAHGPTHFYLGSQDLFGS